MNNQTDVSIKFRNYVEGSGKLEKYAQTLATINAVVGGFDKNSAKALEASAISTKNISSEISNMSHLTKLAFNYTTAREFARALQRVFSEMTRLVTKSTEYLENINLYQVAFDGYYQSADRFINKMSEMYGLDESWLTRTVGVFRQMANAMGVSAETGERLSTILTQMSVDISSLYNTDMERASSVLQSALAGQTKPIRGLTGGDITQATLQTTLDNLGIDQAVASLSFAEKRLLIIISLTKQLNESIGDMGRTIESPANQMRVLNSQWERLSRATGNVFLPILSKILPYLNATLMVLTEIMETVAVLFGYDKNDFDYFAGTADSVLELEEGLNGASASAKKLKQGLRGFDKLNVISTPTKTSATAGAGGVDPDIMKAFNSAFDDYQKKLDNVQMKATKIRDAVMEWLGFTKEINYETGEIEWHYQGLPTTLKNMFQWFSKLNPKAKILVGLIGALFAKSIIKNAQTIVKLLGKTGLGKAITNMISPLKTLGGMLKTDLQGGFYGLNSAMKESINLWSKNLGGMERFNLTLLGAGGIVAGFQATKSAMKDVREEGLNLANGLGTTVGALGQIVGAGMAGTTLGGVTGGLIGLIIGGVSTAISMMAGIDSALTENQKSFQETAKEVDNLYTKWHDAEEARVDYLKQNQGENEYYKGLYEELQNIVDENGKIKKGYEDRAEFIAYQLSNALGIEIDIVDNQIQKYEDLTEAVQKSLDKKMAMANLSVLEERYTEAVKNRAEAEQLYGKTIQESQTARKDYMDKIQELGEHYHLTQEAIDALKDGTIEWHDVLNWSDSVVINNKLKKYRDAVNSTSEEEKKAKEILENYTNSIYLYSKAYKYVVDENYTALNEFLNWEAQTYGKSKKQTEEYYNNQLIANQKSLEDLKKNKKNYSDEEYNALVSHYEGLISLAKEKLEILKLTSITSVDQLTDDMVTKWGEMATSSTDEFLANFKELPSDIQKEIVDKMYDKGYKISDELKRGIEAINPKVKIDADTKSLGQKLKDLFNGKNSLLGKIGFSLPSINWKAFGFADGGLPPVGQLFVANERGAELVGHIGGKTFVANQNQMMDLLDKKIGNAQSGGNQTFIIQVGDEEVAKVVLNKASEIAKTNGKPIKIG